MHINIVSIFATILPSALVWAGNGKSFYTCSRNVTIIWDLDVANIFKITILNFRYISNDQGHTHNNDSARQELYDDKEGNVLKQTWYYGYFVIFQTGNHKFL